MVKDGLEAVGVTLEVEEVGLGESEKMKTELGEKVQPLDG